MLLVSRMVQPCHTDPQLMLSCLVTHAPCDLPENTGWTLTHIAHRRSHSSPRASRWTVEPPPMKPSTKILGHRTGFSTTFCTDFPADLTHHCHTYIASCSTSVFQDTHKHVMSSSRWIICLNSEDKYFKLSLWEPSLLLREKDKEGPRSLQLWRRERKEGSWGTPSFKWPSMNLNLQSE